MEGIVGNNIMELNTSRPFFSTGVLGYSLNIGNYFGTREIKFDSKLAVPTGPEFSSRTLSVRYWRRVPDAS